MYVGGLDEKVTEAILWELFLQAGPVGMSLVSVWVCLCMSPVSVWVCLSILCHLSVCVHVYVTCQCVGVFLYVTCQCVGMFLYVTCQCVGVFVYVTCQCVGVYVTCHCVGGCPL